MPRGSNPGTKRGGRKRGTPNRRTILADRIFVAAAAHPMAGWKELLSVLLDDMALPAETRLAIAQKSRSAAARSNRPRGKTTNPKSAARLSRKQAAVELDALFRLARNMSLAEEERRKAAMLIARLLLPTTPTGDPSWSRAVADEYGFVISPKIASEYRDAKLLLEKLKNGNGSIRPGNARQAEKVRTRLAAIRRSLVPPPHSKYGRYRPHRRGQPFDQDQFQKDLGRLLELRLRRRSKIGLTEQEVAEEAHRMARADTLKYGAEGEARSRLAHLESEAKLAAPLESSTEVELRLLRLLYWTHSPTEDPEQAHYHPLRDATPANDGNLYPYNSKRRPPPYLVDEDGVQIADMPQIVYSNPNYWPYTPEGRPLLVVPPTVVPENSIHAASPEEAGSSHDRRADRNPPSACNPRQQPIPVAAPGSK